MTERGRKSVDATPHRFVVGPSQMAWDGQKLVVTLKERAAPWPRAIVGRITLTPRFITDCAVALEPTHTHRWWPVAPFADVEVELDKPVSRWQGHGYFDTNAGDAPLEEHFREWDWSRAQGQHASHILYDVTGHNGPGLCLGLSIDENGGITEFAPPPKVPLKRAFWGVDRATRSQRPAELINTLEDSPFYARSLVRSSLNDEQLTSVHETLSLTRFANPLVKFLLPFRMPRRA